MTTQLDNPQPPRLPDHPPAYSSGVMMTLNNVLRLYFNRLANLLNALVGTDGGVYLQNPHAMLMSDQDQTNPSITGANQLSFNQPIITQGIRVENTDEIWFDPGPTTPCPTPGLTSPPARALPCGRTLSLPSRVSSR